MFSYKFDILSNCMSWQKESVFVSNTLEFSYSFAILAFLSFPRKKLDLITQNCIDANSIQQSVRDAEYNMTNLGKFVALHYERHPESMRTVPWLRPAGRDSVPWIPQILRIPRTKVVGLGNTLF